MIGRPLLLAALTGVAGLARAETLSVTEGASYAMSDEETRNAGRQHCVEAAKHTALDRAGSVFEAELNSDASEAGKDEAQLRMRSYFAGVVSSELVTDHIDVDDRGRALENCQVKITYDPETVSAKMREIADAEELRRQVIRQQSTIMALQSEVQQTALPPAAQAAQTAPPAGFAAPPQMQQAYAPPHALVPAAAAAPQPVYYAPPAYYPQQPVPIYSSPPRVYVVPQTQPVYYVPRQPVPAMLVVKPKPRRIRLVRLFTWWRN
jgi:hypothetical protein